MSNVRRLASLRELALSKLAFGATAQAGRPSAGGRQVTVVLERFFVKVGGRNAIETRAAVLRVALIAGESRSPVRCRASSCACARGCGANAIVLKH